MPNRDAMPPWVHASFGPLHYASTGGTVTAYQGTPVAWTPVQHVNDGLHPLPVGPVDSLSGGLMVGALFIALYCTKH